MHKLHVAGIATLIIAGLLILSPGAQAQSATTTFDVAKVLKGFQVAPVPLNMQAIHRTACLRHGELEGLARDGGRGAGPFGGIESQMSDGRRSIRGAGQRDHRVGFGERGTAG